MEKMSVADLPQRDRVVLLALAGWTLLVWVGRIRNVVASEFEGWAFGWRLGVAVVFTLSGVLLAATVLTRSSLARPVAGCLALVGAGWWLVRGTGILLAEYDVGFKVVHTVLATVTVGLSWLVLRWWAADRTFATDHV